MTILFHWSHFFFHWSKPTCQCWYCPPKKRTMPWWQLLVGEVEFLALVVMIEAFLPPLWHRQFLVHFDPSGQHCASTSPTSLFSLYCCYNLPLICAQSPPIPFKQVPLLWLWRQRCLFCTFMFYLAFFIWHYCLYHHHWIRRTKNGTVFWHRGKGLEHGGWMGARSDAVELR